MCTSARMSIGAVLALFAGGDGLLSSAHAAELPRKLVVRGDRAYWVLEQLAVPDDKAKAPSPSYMTELLSVSVDGTGPFRRRLLRAYGHYARLTSWTVGEDALYCFYRGDHPHNQRSFSYARIGLGKISRCPELPDFGTGPEARLGSATSYVFGLSDMRKTTWQEGLIDAWASASPAHLSYIFPEKREKKTFFYDLVCRRNGEVQLVLLEDDRLTGWVYGGIIEHRLKWDVAFRGRVERHAPMIASCANGHLYLTFDKGETFALDLKAATEAADHSVRARRISDKAAELVIVDRDADQVYAATGNRLWNLATPSLDVAVEPSSAPANASEDSVLQRFRSAVSAARKLADAKRASTQPR